MLSICYISVQELLYIYLFFYLCKEAPEIERTSAFTLQECLIWITAFFRDNKLAFPRSHINSIKIPFSKYGSYFLKLLKDQSVIYSANVTLA